MEEVRKDIQGYEGIYQVSNLGRIKSLKRKVKGRVGMRRQHGKIMNMTESHRYYLVTLSNNGKKGHSVHRLVATTFIENPYKKPQVNHKDGDKHNNCVTNLERVTISENRRHSYDVLGQKPTPGIRGKYNKLSKRVYQFTCQGEFIKGWDSLSDVSRSEGYSVGGLSECCNGKKKTCGGYKRSYQNPIKIF